MFLTSVRRRKHRVRPVPKNVNLLALSSCLLLLACGASPPSGESTPQPQPAGGEVLANETSHPPTEIDSVAASAARELEGAARIRREELAAVLEAGLGRFLQRVETEPHARRGRFVGFRLRTFFDDDPRYVHVDLRVGDTITRVNGRSVERPEQALAIWNELADASELVVEYLREGEPRELRFVIE